MAPRKHRATGNPRGFQPGNQMARLGTHGRPDFITQQLIATLNEAPKKTAKMPPEVKTKYAQMVRKLVELANDGEQWAIKFIWERVEGQVPLAARTQMEQRLTLEQVLPLLDERQLEVMEEVARKALVLEAKLGIERQPGASMPTGDRHRRAATNRR